jgi:transposase-like protein
MRSVHAAHDSDARPLPLSRTAQIGAPPCDSIVIMQTTAARTTILSATCPLCHTTDPAVTAASILAGARWVCATCGQTWSASRLEAAAAYAQFNAAHP